MNEEKVTESTAIFPVTANPPTFGMLLTLYNVADHFDKIYVIVKNKEYVFKPDISKAMLEAILCKYSSKFAVIISDINFEEDTIIDNRGLPSFDAIITDSVIIYSNLLSKGYKNLKMIPSSTGWDETFHRVAYVRSAIYDELQKRLMHMRM